MDDIGVRLTIAMRAHNMRDKQLAEKMSVSVGLIGQWRRGTRIPSDKLRALCQHLNINGHWFLFGEGSRNPPCSKW